MEFDRDIEQLPENLRKCWNGKAQTALSTFYFGDIETYKEDSDFSRQIGQTSFHRHTSVMRTVINFLLKLPPKELKILSAPCSVGCEPYSFAMMALAEGLYRHHERVDIDAVDLSQSFMDAARDGQYPYEMLRGALRSKNLRHFHFDDETETARISDRMKKRVNFLPAQDICTLDTDKDYDVMFMFNLLCKLGHKETRRLADTIADIQPAILATNNLYMWNEAGYWQENYSWPVVDRVLKDQGYVLMDNVGDMIAPGHKSLRQTYKAHRAKREGSSNVIFVRPDKFPSLAA